MIRIVTNNRFSQKNLLKITGTIASEISELLKNMPVPQRGFKQYNIDVDIKISPVKEAPVVKVIFIDDVGKNEYPLSTIKRSHNQPK